MSTDPLYVAVCTDRGQCAFEAIPPEIILSEPASETVLAEGTRTVRVAGTLETASDAVTLKVSGRNDEGCGAAREQTLLLSRTESGVSGQIPFVIDAWPVDSGTTRILLEASQSTGRALASADVTVPCAGCAVIEWTEPAEDTQVLGLELEEIAGRITPRSAADAILWQVNGAGGVFSGSAPVNSSGDFSARYLPLFAGENQVSARVTGVGSGLGERRCSRSIRAGKAFEEGLRVVLIQSDAAGDVDVHLVSPTGQFGSSEESLSAQSPSPSFGGEVRASSDRSVPETLTVETLAAGSWGLLVQAVTDGELGASTVAWLWVLYDGALVRSVPLGPRALRAADGEIWLAARLEVGTLGASLVELDRVVTEAPSGTPSTW